jgi:hypothetical protein
VNQENAFAESGTSPTEWTPAEEAIVARIMATETMHDPENYTGDRRIACTRPEALRRLQRRKARGIYRAPTGIALASATPPITDEWQDTPARHAARLKSLRRGVNCSGKGTHAEVSGPKAGSACK